MTATTKWNHDGKDVKFAYLGHLSLAYKVDGEDVTWAWACRNDKDAPNKKLARQVAFGRLVKGKEGQVFRETFPRLAGEHDDEFVRRVLDLEKVKLIAG